MEIGGLRLFVVYHQRLHPQMYAELSNANLARLIFYKVNETIPFEAGLPGRKLRLIKEYELPDYDPFYQAHAFNEASCMIHALRNALVADCDYVGIVQYDMGISDRDFAYWDSFLASGASALAPARYGVVDPALLEQDYVLEAPFYGFPMAYVVDSFCRRFGIERQVFMDRLAARHAEGQQLALLNSFILRRPLFEALAGWIAVMAKELYAYTLANPDHRRHHGHMGGLIERCVGLFLLFHCPDGEVVAPLGLKHHRIRELHRTKFGQI